MTKVELVVSCLLFVFHKELKGLGFTFHVLYWQPAHKYSINGLGFKIQHEMNCPP